MRKHGGTPSRRDKHVTLAAISPPGVARGRFVGGQQSGLAGSKPPPLFTRAASSCSSQGRRQGEPWGASPRPSAPTYLPPEPWFMIFSEIMRAGDTFVPGFPPWEVTFSRLMCSGVGEPRMVRWAGLGVTFQCSPVGASGLMGPVFWAASPGPPPVWLVGKGGQAEG